MTKVSVLLPVYNTDPAQLRDAVESVLKQTFTDFELLIVDDGSDKAGLEDIVTSYGDARIRYIKNERNAGIAKVRNTLIDLASGTYLAVMDHDDICLPRRLEKQVEFMDHHPDVGVCGCAYKRFGRMFKNKTIRYPVHDDDIRVALFFKNVIHHPGAMIRKSILDEHALRYDETMISVNDRKLFIDIGRVSKLANLPDVLCYYRLHKGMTSLKKRNVINEEQVRFRKNMLGEMGIEFNNAQAHILNHYILNGRAKIASKDILVQIEKILSHLSEINRLNNFLPAEKFSNMCALYLIKRCNNALLRSGVLSAKILTETNLPVAEIRQPAVLRLCNSLARLS